MIVEAIEDFAIEHTLYDQFFGNGTVKKGTRFEVIREPIPEKKLYKLKEISKFNTGFLYVRRSFFNKYFVAVE